MSKEVIIIGGGIIGLCSAYYLNKAGHQVTVIDQSNMNSGASYVNAGYLSPSHIIPLAAPGVVKTGLKWMFNPSSPLYIKPRLDFDFLRWIWAFNKSCSIKNVNKAIPVIKDITVLSQKLYDNIKHDEKFTFHSDKKGLLMLCKTEEMLATEVKLAEVAKQNGLDVCELNVKALQALEPHADFNVKGAVYFKCDSHMTPHEFMIDMKSYLERCGVKCLTNEKVEDVEINNGKISTIITSKHVHKADDFVLATGSWSPILSKKIGIKLLVQAGKGYRINSTNKTGITIPAILAEAKVAITPMHGFTRFAGTMEIAGINHTINKVRVEAIANAVTNYYPEIKLTPQEIEDVAVGLRPVSPDGLPYIGKSSKCDNLTIATGHAMLGWSMGTATGKLVSEIVSNTKTSLKLDAFHPDRRF